MGFRQEIPDRRIAGFEHGFQCRVGLLKGRTEQGDAESGRCLQVSTCLLFGGVERVIEEDQDVDAARGHFRAGEKAVQTPAGRDQIDNDRCCHKLAGEVVIVLEAIEQPAAEVAGFGAYRREKRSENE